MTNQSKFTTVVGMAFEGKTVVLGVCGGIAAYKTCELTRLLVKEGAVVHIILTKSAEKFVTPLTLQTLSQSPIHTDLFSLTEEAQIGHIQLADRADLVVVAPATANILAKVAHGLCDDLLSTVICATQAPVVFAPAMNVHMWENKITQENVAKLKGHGYHILPPASGELACGYEGKGRFPEPALILNKISVILSETKDLY